MRAALAAYLKQGHHVLLLLAAPAVLLLGITLYITLGQVFGKYPPRFDWPTFYRFARFPAWVAILLLVADALINTLWRLDIDPAETDPGDADD